MIQATKLPPRYMAPAYVSTNQIDLSNLSSIDSDSQRLTTGDVLNVEVLTGIEEDQEVTKTRVTEAGDVSIPIIGQVQVAGLTLDQTQNRVREEAIQRRKFVDPIVAVALDKRMMRRVAVFGAVSAPGTYEIPAYKCDLAAAISAAGGLTADADTTVQIRKPASSQSPFQTVGFQQPSPQQPLTNGPTDTLIEIDLVQPANVIQEQLDLSDGSVVMIKQRETQSVFVTGMVRSPKQLEMPINSDLRLLDAITMVGGRSTPLAQKIKVIRKLEGQASPIYISTSYSKAKKNDAANLRLAAGDIISVEETPGLLLFDGIRSVLNFGIGANVPVL